MNPSNYPVQDNRIGVTPWSVTNSGAACDTILVFGSVVAGQTGLTVIGYNFAASDDDPTTPKWISMVGLVGGVPTRFDAQLAGVTAGTGSATLDEKAPFSATDYSITLGHPDDTALAEAVAVGRTGPVVQIPSNNTACWARTAPLTLVGESLAGQSAANGSALLGGAGLDTLVPSGGGTGQEIHHLTIYVDARIDATKPWNFDNDGTTTSETPVYRPVGLLTPYANDPLGPGWVRGSEPYGLYAFNGVATTTSGGTVICVQTSTVPPIGADIVFPQYAGGAVVHTEVASAAGTCSSGSPLTLTSGTGLTAVTQNEFFYGEAPGASASGTAVQEIASSTQCSAPCVIPATGRTFPMQINLKNPNNPEPGAESDFAPFGLVKIDSEECQYYQTSSYPYVAGQWLNLTACAQNGTTAAAHAVGAAIVPLNPFEPTYPWPVTTINTAGNQTPATAEYFPAWTIGNAAISQPIPNGAAYSSPTAFAGAHVHDLQIQIWPVTTFSGAEENPYNFSATNSTAGMYLVPLPFNSRFDHIYIGTSQNEDPPQFGIFEGAASINTHDYFTVLGPTADTDIWDSISIRAGYPFDFVGGSTGKYSNIQLFSQNGPPATGWYPYTPAVGSGAAIGGMWSAFGPDDTVGLGQGAYGYASECYDSVMSNIYLEAQGGALDDTQPLWVLDCNSSTWDGQGDISEGTTFVDGTASHYSGAVFSGSPVNLPLIINGSFTTIDFAQISGDRLSNALGIGSVLNWGAENCVSGFSNNGDSRLSFGSCKATQPGQTQEFALLGNLTNSQVNNQSGFFPSDIWTNDPNGTGSPITIGRTFDGTPGNQLQEYSGCGVGTGVYNVQCTVYLNNGGGGYMPEFGPGQAIQQTKYLVTVQVRECNAYPCTDSAQTFGMYFSSSSGYIDVSHTAIPISTTWTTQQFIVDLSSAPTDSAFEFQINGTSTTATNIEFSYISLVPLPDQLPVQQTTPADNISCVAGSIVGTDANYIYVCAANGTVKRASLSSY